MAAGNKRLYQVKKQIYRKLGCLSGKKNNTLKKDLAEPEEEESEGLQGVHGADKTAHWIKELAVKRGDLSSASVTNTVTGGAGCLQVLF